MSPVRRRSIALPLSVVLHAAALYAVSRAPSVFSEARAGLSPPTPLVWIEMRAREPVEPAEIPDEPSPIAPPKPQPVAPAQEHRADPVRAEPVPKASVAPVEPAPAATEPSPPIRPAPRVDWDKARRDAAAAVVEDQERAGEYRTFSLDDFEKPQPLPVEPAPPPMVVDNCVVASNKFARFAAQMMGRCVREPRGDLFAAIKPAYLEARPACVETRPESPGAVTSRGEVISTVKCELVVDEDD